MSKQFKFQLDLPPGMSWNLYFKLVLRKKHLKLLDSHRFLRSLTWKNYFSIEFGFPRRFTNIDGTCGINQWINGYGNKAFSVMVFVMIFSNPFFLSLFGFAGFILDQRPHPNSHFAMIIKFMQKMIKNLWSRMRIEYKPAFKVIS